MLHVTFNMGIGGTEQVIRQLVVGSMALNVDGQILCIDGYVGPIGQAMQESGVSIITLRRMPGFDIALIKAMHTHIKASGADIVHCHQYTPYLYGFLAAIGTEAKVVFTEHGRFYPDRYRYKAMGINMLIGLMTPAIAAISSATREALARYEFMPKWKIQVVYNGIQGLVRDDERTNSLRHKLQIPPDAFVVGTVSRLDPVKNQPMMLRAFRRFLDRCPDAWLLMVGDGPDRSKLEAMTKELHLAHRVIFTGFQADPVDYLAALDLFLLSSHTEGTSMTLLEAMSLGIPAVATHVGGNPEIIKQHETGILVPPDDDVAFAAAMIKIKESPDLIDTMSRNSLERFQSNFCVQNMVNQYHKLYLHAI